MLDDIVVLIVPTQITGSEVIIGSFVNGVDAPVDTVDENVGVLAMWRGATHGRVEVGCILIANILRSVPLAYWLGATPIMPDIVEPRIHHQRVKA
jgi:hypothetical protein